jgi:ribose transport system permease protein
MKKNNFFIKFLKQREISVLLIILIAVAIVQIIQPKFLNVSNLRSIAISMSTDGLMSIGLCLALILGGIELSVGGVAAMTCVIAGYLCIAGVNIWVACIASLISGIAVGLFNGLMISKVGLPPFIVTLGMMSLSRGVAYILTEGSPLSLSGYLPDSFRFLATGNIFNIPMLFIIFIVIAIIAGILTKKAKACRNIFYVGSNENAAKLSGINVDKVKISVYVVIALLSTLSGVLNLARFNVATPQLSVGAETTAISAAVIGGTSMTGGVGSILGTVFGIALLNIVNSAMVMMNVSVYWQDFVQGAILVLAVTMDYISHRKTGRTSILMKFFGAGKKADKNS